MARPYAEPRAGAPGGAGPGPLCFCPARRPRLPAWRLGLAWLALACLGWPLAAAAAGTTATLVPDREIASVGDLVTLRMQDSITLLPVGGLAFAYRLPATGRYVPNSVVVNGTPVGDGGSVTVTRDSVRVWIAVPSLGVNRVDLTVRVVGAIGQGLVHRGTVRVGTAAAVAVRGPTTWIEDENATALVPALGSDTFINKEQPGFNYGATRFVEARTGTERRPLLRFDLAALPAPIDGMVVQAAYLQLWTTLTTGAPVTLNAHAMRSTWAEGGQNGTACVDGATWNTRNCVSAWTSGGDYESLPVGSTVLDPASGYAVLDITPLAAEWVAGTKPNHGLVLVSSSSKSKRSVTFPSREGVVGATPAARLVIVLAPSKAYATQAVTSCTAEITPTTVLKGTGNQRFVYSLLAQTSAEHTGTDRFAIAVPAGFALVGVDTVRVAGTPLVVNDDEVLGPGEYESWGSGSLLDVRYWPPATATLTRIEAVFRASVPATADPGKEFLSVVDHDRRGYPVQSTIRGDANGDAGDANTWTVITVSELLVGVTVTPADTTVAAGRSVPYRATARYSDTSLLDVTGSATWQVSPGTLGGFTGAPGVLITSAPGSGTVTATFGGMTSPPVAVQVGPPVLDSIRISPSSASVAAGLAATFEADAIYSDGTSVRVTSSAAWSVDDTAIATVVSPGRVRGNAAGNTVVRAAFGGVTGTAAFQVTPAQLVTIAIDPADTTIALGLNVQLRATGTYTDGGTADVTGIAIWIAAPNGIVDVDASGLAAALGEGVASITASVGTVVSSAARFAVGPAEPVSIAIAPADTSVALGFPVQYTATGTFTDGSTRDVTRAAAWSADPAGIATLDSTGLAATVGEGSTAVRATLGGATSPAAALVVGPAVVLGLDGAPDAATVPLGAPHLVTSTAHYSDGAAVDVTASATWQSLDPAVADFDAPGSLQTFATGQARLVHAFAGAGGDTLRLNVTTATLDSLVVAPCGIALPPGVERPFHATAYFNDLTVQDLTAQATWTSSVPSVAGIAAGGLLSALAAGSTDIQATVLGVSSTPCAVTVDPNAVTAIAVVPSDTTLAAGQQLQYTARGSVGGDLYDLTAQVTWTTGAGTVAAVSSGGLVTTVAAGTTTVQAAYASALGTASLEVTPATIVQVEVLPASTTVRLGNTKNLTARATYSNGGSADVSALAGWTSSAPTVAYTEPGGLVRALALGSAQIRAAFAGVTSAPATVTVLPAVHVEALAAGSEDALPGAVDRLLLALRFQNGYLDTRRIRALRVDVSGPAAQLRLHLDDGDGIFEPTGDATLASGPPAAGSWSAIGLAVDLGVGTARTLFVSGDVSATAASHGDLVDATLPDVADVFEEPSTAVVAAGPFPLDSAGQLRVQDLALSQLEFTPGPDSVLVAGSLGVPLFSLQLPADGPLADTLDHLELQQLGTAREGIDVTAVRLQYYDAGWQDVATLVPSGGGRWSATGIGLSIPASGRLARVVADIGAGAATNRTVQFELPALGCRFASGRRGPADAGWVEPQPHRIDSPEVLIVQGVDVASGAVIARTARRVPLLGLELTLRGAITDSVASLRFDNSTANPLGPPADPNAEIARAELWLDRDADGAAGAADSLLEGLVPAPGSSLHFGGTAALALPLQSNSPVRLLLVVDPDSARVRDDERLAVRFAAATTGHGVAVQAQEPLQPALPPVVDGQHAQGYGVRPIANTLVTPGASDVLVLDFVLPANGFEADVLQRLQIRNAGSADTGDIAAVHLYQDDGDGSFGAADLLVAELPAADVRAWEATGLAVDLPGGTAPRFFVAVDVAVDATPGRTFSAEVDLGDVEVASGNDGPNDAVVAGGGPVIITATGQVLWVAGVAGSHTVRPDARQHVALVLETLNSYATERRLQSLSVAVRGTAAPFEYDLWALHADTNGNGAVDPEETPLTLQPVNGNVVRFDGLDLALPPLVQQRFLVTYSLAAGLARDGSVIDAAIETAADFGYALASGPTTTTGQFEMNSPGQDVVDGQVASQIDLASIVPQALGGGESNVLALDVVLPSNGWEADVLNGLEVEILADSTPVQFGSDLAAMRLWRETDADFAGARFDPSQDALLQTLLPGAPALRFDGLSAAIPVGGRRFYVTLDVAASPVDGREIRLRVPVGGVQVASGNDGPLDEAVTATATHRISSSQLLATVTTTPLGPSVGQPVEVAIIVRNRGSAAVAAVVPHRFDIEPALPFTWLAGPTPPQLALAAGASDTLRYRVQIDAPGRCSFVAQVGTPDSTILAEPALGPLLDVRRVASAIELEPRSNLPAVVSRGQSGTTPIVWNLTHADSDDLAGTILVRAVRFEVETATGAPQSAAAVFERLEVRSGGIVRALLGSVPDTTSIRLGLDPPVAVQPGGSIDLPLEATIADSATAASFQLRITGSGSVQADDAGSGQAVPLVASLPWTTPVTAIRTVAARVDVDVEPLLPPGVNRGQDDVPIGTVHFSLPGNPGESEARIVRLTIACSDSAAAALDPAVLFDRVEVHAGSSLLLTADSPAAADGRLSLPLTIPRTFASGAPEALTVSAGLRDDAPPLAFAIAIAAAADLVVQDATSGVTVPVAATPPDSFPAPLGSSRVYDAAQSVTVGAVSRLPGSTSGSAVLQVADLTLAHPGGPGTADVLLRGMAVRLTDPTGALLVPRNALVGLEVRQGAGVVAEAAALPTTADAVAIEFTTPLRLATGSAVALSLHAGLTAAPSPAAFRFALEGSAFDLVDANDPARPVLSAGALPFATSTLLVLSSPAAVEIGVAEAPPANLARGQSNAAVLRLQVRHPGAASEAAMVLTALGLHLEDAGGQPLDASRLIAAARLRDSGSEVAAALSADSLAWDLSGQPPLAAGAAWDATLEIDVRADTDVEDFRLVIRAEALAANAGSGRLPLRAGPGTDLPYRSPSVHVSAPDLASSFSNYPNPFAAGRQSTRIPFYMAASGRVTVEVRTLNGERVVRLLDGAERAPGLHDDLTWDGRNGRGEVVRNGTYVLCIEVEGPSGGRARRKLAVVR